MKTSSGSWPSHQGGKHERAFMNVRSAPTHAYTWMHTCSSPQPLFEPLRLNGQTVEQVEAFRYLGTDMDTHLSFSQHTDSVYKKAQQRLFLLRKLRSFDVKQDILTAVYKSLIESVLTFNITSWFTLTSVKNKSKLSRIVNQGSKITGKTQIQLSVLHSQAVKRKAHLITQDPTHPWIWIWKPLLYAGTGWRAMETDLVTRTWGMLCVGKREMSVCEVLCWSWK